MIGAFTFNTSQRIVFENGSAAKLGEHAAPFLGARPFLVTDPGIVSLDLHAPCEAALHSAGCHPGRFTDVIADPPRILVEAAVESAKAHGATSVIGFGGGSSLDVAKLVALLLGSGEDLDNAWGVGNAKGPRLPLILVPTTAGTGSEVTPISIITVGEEEKRGVVSPFLLPDLAVLDPLLTLGLPGPVTAATGIDAMVHAIEGYASTSANNNPVSRTLAVEALRLLGTHIQTAVFSPADVEARGAMLLGSMLAGMAFANSPVAAVHALAYPIGGTFHVPHGLSNALVLPHVLKFNNKVAAKTYAEIAAVPFPELAAIQDADERADRFAGKLAELAEDLGLQTCLREVGIRETDLPKLAADAMKQTRLLVNNPRELREADALQIYKAAL
ncbi:iron-containing alcohol dehydrogenase [Roseibium sediminicola]|uniref:Iron-containing alcohol dehydrogenase n=1 Tax=Roseibium sediminicola TaxID=2933272 RepID=A0ABT0GR03_9HYPH|nr:iron-containing alcohol dehydrogenase [Roseibium sp. CAU 1639]MCK7611867.1 iron-containing alcohol dehydrogenase [Roseibium sp. CAU 1639]